MEPGPFQQIRVREFLGYYLIAGVAISLFIAQFSLTHLGQTLGPSGLRLLHEHIEVGALVLWIFLKTTKTSLDLGPLIGSGTPILPIRTYLTLVLSLMFFSFASINLTYTWVIRLLPGLSPVHPEAGPPLFTLLTLNLRVILAAFLEEILFRGIILHRWALRWGLARGIILSSLLFAVLHPLNIPGMFVFGLLMAFLYLRTQSLWAPILTHALYNLVVSALSLLSTGGGEEGDPLISGIFFLILAAPGLVSLMIRYWPKTTPLPYFNSQIH